MSLGGSFEKLFGVWILADSSKSFTFGNIKDYIFINLFIYTGG